VSGSENSRGEQGKYGLFKYDFPLGGGVVRVQFLEVRTVENTEVVHADESITRRQLSAGMFLHLSFAVVMVPCLT
jgi:hypothetical protein